MLLLAKMKISDFKFTPTEKKVLSCFVNKITAHKALAKILGSSEKTIKTHIDNIKHKIAVDTKEEVIKFVSKCNRHEIKYLNNIFKQLFFVNQYTEVAEKISDNISHLKATCVCSVLLHKKETALAEIEKTISTLGFNFYKSQISKHHPRTKKQLQENDFRLYVSKSPEALQALHEENAILVCLGEQQNNYDNIIFYNKNNLKEFYHQIIKFLINRYPIVKRLNKQDNLLEKIDIF